MTKTLCNECRSIGHKDQTICWHCGSNDLREVKMAGISTLHDIKNRLSKESKGEANERKT